MTLTLADVVRWVERNFWRRSVHRSTSSGATHAGLPVVLDAGGKLDDSFTADTLTPATGIMFAHDTLDYYRITTWTPSVAGVTLSTALGRYVRLGRLVMADFYCVWPSTADATNIAVEGLPFTAVTPVSGLPAGSVIFAIVTYPTAPIVGLVNGGTTNFTLRAFGSGTLLTNANMSTYQIRGTVMYETAS